MFEQNSTTKSTVRLKLSPEDNGKYLQCVAHNQQLKNMAMILGSKANISTGNEQSAFTLVSSTVHQKSPTPSPSPPYYVGGGVDDDPESIFPFSLHDQITLMVKCK